MCGIVGRVARESPIDPELLRRMCDVIRHRGPDAQGVFVDEHAALGIQRLAIIDLQTGDQPIFNEDESVVVVLNGEIYNYVELRADLEKRGHSFRTHSDTEVIVHLYEELGERCVDPLRGMFAFAIWDRRDRRLLLARDRLGKKPLFYSERDGTLWFGSETKAILQDPAVPRDVDWDAIDAFLHFGYVPDPLSAFAALRKLPPAHILSWKGGRVVARRYWRLSYASRPPGEDGRDAAELVRAALLEATRLRLRSDVPLGAFLSGGIDSTAVVAAMSRVSEATVKTFSIGFDVDQFDETRFAREVAEMFGTEHHEFRLTPDVMELLPRLVWHYGEPFADPSAVPSMYLAEATRRHVKVALNGDGGDESFAGYSRYVAATIASRLAFVPAPVARAVGRVADTVGGSPPRFTIARRARSLADLVAVDFNQRYTDIQAQPYLSEADRAALYTPEFSAGLAPLACRSAPHVIADAMRGSDASTALEQLLDADVNTYLPGDLLVKVDIATMANSLEVRSPLLDHVFMELVAGLPATQKLRRTKTKVALKNALRDWVPQHIIDRPKMGFRVPLAPWFRGKLRQLPADVLLDPRSLGRGILREDRLRRLIDRHLDGSEDNSGKLWSLIQLELWFRTYIDVAPAGPIALGNV